VGEADLVGARSDLGDAGDPRIGAGRDADPGSPRLPRLGFAYTTIGVLVVDWFLRAARARAVLSLT
jgi:hypothetical protein